MAAQAPEDMAYISHWWFELAILCCGRGGGCEMVVVEVRGSWSVVEAWG